MTPDEATRAGWTLQAGLSGFPGLVGGFWSRRDGEGRRYAALPDARHANNRGVVHGGLLLTFADQALGMTIWESIGRRDCATVQLALNFVAPVQQGELVELEAEIVRTTRSLIFVRAMLRVESRVVATVDGLWKILFTGATPA